ncbi:hypothetical protein AVU38_gp180 [Ralstonia phage RSL2]|uniref:B30.2/SPRY domain-containing protein n=1 Tax=Ralstonia phage RSL2 TaxID=1585840 RepID=A0A0A8J9H5_9CAUD|nr:hypothetical protein AVU38_gp180 [Ralstonia phage RSL2]BAQ02708.1 hypothetical protein [Ralstonia phage RSL2]
MLASTLLLKKKVVVASTATTWDPNNKGTQVTLSNNNLRATISPYGQAVKATLSRNSGKYYFEIIATQFEGSISYSPLIGLGTASTGLITTPWTTATGEIYWYCSNPTSSLIYGNNNRVAYGVTGFTQGDYVGAAVDLDNKILTYYRNGTNEGNINLATYCPGQSTWWPMVCSPYGSNGFTVVDWQATPKYTPSGYGLW